MADWKTVRYDPAYEEPLDPEIIPLCDAMNAAGFVTTSSCCGHGYSWPHVWFEHSTDERIENLARCVLAQEQGENRRYFSMWQKEILLRGSDADTRLYNGTGYAWCVEIHLNNVYATTATSEALKEAVYAIIEIAKAVDRWRENGHGGHD